MAGLWEGRSIVGGRHGHVGTLGEDILRFSASFYRECLDEVAERPADGRAHLRLWGGVLGLPLVPVALVGAYVHFLREERFNRQLMFELVARPAETIGSVPHLAA